MRGHEPVTGGEERVTQEGKGRGESPNEEPIPSTRTVVVDLAELLEESEDVVQRAGTVSIRVRIEAEDHNPMGPQGDLLGRG
jgi:hypothetical protein